MQTRMAAMPDDRSIQFRVGVNLGDVIVEGDDIHVGGANAAARLEGVAAPGGKAVSESVCDQVGNRLDLIFEDRGERLRSRWAAKTSALPTAGRPAERTFSPDLQHLSLYL